MTTPRARVFIADDYLQMRESLRKLLEYEDDFEVCGEAADADAALKGILETRPDIAIVDLVMGKSSGVDLLERLHGAVHQIPVLILTMLPERLNAEFLLEKGAKGYLMKTESADQILNALRQVLRGKIYLSQAMKEYLQQKGHPLR